MLNTSQDLLYLVGAFAVLWLTIFLCWFFYYLILILRDVRQTTLDIKEKVAWWGDLLQTIKEKLVSSTATAALVMRSGLELINYYRTHYGMSKREVNDADDVTEAEHKKGKKTKS